MRERHAPLPYRGDLRVGDVRPGDARGRHGLQAVTGYAIRGDDAVAELMISGNSFVIVLSPPREPRRSSTRRLMRLSSAWRQRSARELEETIPQELFRKFGCYVGWALVEYRENVRLERLVHEGLEAALASSCAREDEAAAERSAGCAACSTPRASARVVLPVFDLDDRRDDRLRGALTRPEGTEFEHPEKLFARRLRCRPRHAARAGLPQAGVRGGRVRSPRAASCS